MTNKIIRHHSSGSSSHLYYVCIDSSPVVPRTHVNILFVLVTLILVLGHMNLRNQSCL